MRNVSRFAMTKVFEEASRVVAELTHDEVLKPGYLYRCYDGKEILMQDYSPYTSAKWWVDDDKTAEKITAPLLDVMNLANFTMGLAEIIDVANDYLTKNGIDSNTPQGRKVDMLYNYHDCIHTLFYEERNVLTPKEQMVLNDILAGTEKEEEQEEERE